MKRKPSSGLPLQERGLAARGVSTRTVLEALERRMLYSVTVGGELSPLLTGAAVPQASLLGGSAARQFVEVATVRATGDAGPFVRIDVAQLRELRADAVENRDAMFDRYRAGRATVDVHDNAGADVITDSSNSTDSGSTGSITAEPALPSLADRVAARAAARAAMAWARFEVRMDAIRAAREEADAIRDSYIDVDGSTEDGSLNVDVGVGVIDVGGSDDELGGVTHPFEINPGAFEDRPSHNPAPIAAPSSDDEPAAAPLPQWEHNPIIAIIDRGNVLPLEPIVIRDAAPDVFGSPVDLGGMMSDALAQVTTAVGEYAVAFRGGASAGGAAQSGDAGTLKAASASVEGSGSTDPAATLDVSSPAQVVPGKAQRPAVAVVTRGEDEEEARRHGRAHIGLTGETTDSDSVIAGSADGGIVPGDGDGGMAAAATRGLMTMTGISTVASLLSVAEANAGIGESIVVVPPAGLAAVAAAADAALPALASRAAASTETVGIVVAGGALAGAHRMFEFAKDAATAVEAMTGAMIPSPAPAAGPGGGFELAQVNGTLLGLAPAWDFRGASAFSDAVDGESIAGAWRVAAAGSLIVTLAGCWYCATAAKRLRVRNRRIDVSRFASARRIRFNPRPV